MKQQQLKLKANAYGSLLKLITIQFWRNLHTIFFIYLFPIIFIATWGYLTLDNNGPMFMSSIIGIVTFQIVSSGIQQVPSAIMEFKNSVLLKRIGATPIKPIDFILCVVIVYLSFIILQIFWIILWMVLIFGFHDFSGLNDQTITGIQLMFHGSVDWGGFIVSEIYIVLLACIVGIFVSSVSKTAAQATALSMAFFFLAMLLSGQLIPIYTIDNNPFFKVVSWMTPFRYGNQLAFMAWNGISIFNSADWNSWIQGPGGVHIYDFAPWMGWVSWFLPLVYSGIFIGVSVYKFKWYVR